MILRFTGLLLNYDLWCNIKSATIALSIEETR